MASAAPTASAPAATGASASSATAGVAGVPAPAEPERKIDLESVKGRFGWCEFEKNFIPYLFR